MKDSLSDQLKVITMDFLRKERFHQNFRNEILFGLFPKSLQKGADQTNSIPHLIDTLQYRGYLRKERGLEKLPTIRRLMNILKMSQISPSFQLNVMRLDDFVHRSKFQLSL